MKPAIRFPVCWKEMNFFSLLKKNENINSGFYDFFSSFFYCFVPKMYYYNFKKKIV